KEEMTLAVLEGVAFALRQNIDIIRSLGVDIAKSKVCGGGTKNKLWLKILASVLNINLEIPVLEHGGALGAAMIAAKSSLVADEYQATEEEFYKIKETVTPDESLVDFYNEKYKKYLGIYPAVRTAMQ
ncbi:MAG: xylulokinase, partial [Clostridia bacterium]|nr:xylulokinase [Clostridia bacterium]